MEETEVENFLDYTPYDDEGDEKNARAIILAATYGEGEPTDNSTAMVQMCKDYIGGSPEEEEKKWNRRPLGVLLYCCCCVANRHKNWYSPFVPKRTVESLYRYRE